MRQRKVEEKKIHSPREARLTIDCSIEQKKKIKILAAAKEMSITDFMLELVEEKYPWCPLGLNHVPNHKTISSIEASERGEGIKSFQSIEELFEELGI